MDRFLCLICGYIHTGDTPPANCPVCDAPAENFELLEETAAAGEVKSEDIQSDKNAIIDETVGKILILGGGIAALSTAEGLRELSESVEITIVTNEERLPYYRLNLTKYLAGEVLEGDLCIHQQYWYDENRINVYKGRIITDIDRDSCKVICSDGLELDYDKLVIALGAHPFIPPVEGISQPGVISLRSVEDANQLKERVGEGSEVLVIGGGILGLEAAGALSVAGAKVTVAEGAKWLMPRQLNDKAAIYVEYALDRLGIDVVYNFRTRKISNLGESFYVESKDGRAQVADTIVVATGVRPNTYLARKAGLEVHSGIIVNDRLVSSDPDIYAVGDISEHYGIAYGLWIVAQYQGKIAARNILGVETHFGGVPRSNTLKVLDADLFSIGEIRAEDAGSEIIEKAEHDSYIMFMIRDGVLVGAIAIGYGSITHKIKKAVESGMHFAYGDVVDADSIIERL